MAHLSQIGDLTIAIIAALFVTLLIIVIEVPSEARTRHRKASFNFGVFVYFLILGIGNAATTMLASTLVDQQLPGPQWFWYAFFGVFGFQIVLKNTNLMVFDQGVLSIQSWIEKGRDHAVAHAIRRDEELTIEIAQRNAAKLTDLDEQTLNGHITVLLGEKVVEKLEEAAGRTGSDAKAIKAFELARGAPDDVAAILRTAGLA